MIRGSTFRTRTGTVPQSILVKSEETDGLRLLRNTPRNQPVLFFYRNRPCVVIGRNQVSHTGDKYSVDGEYLISQNPWKETTPRNLRQWGIPLIRRRSGGGTVFHDHGNTNFSIILPRLLFTRAHGAELVARAVKDRLGVEECTVNSRNDVIIRDGEKELKMSFTDPRREGSVC